MRKSGMTLMWLLCGLALSGCASVSPALQVTPAPVVQQRQLADPPAWVMQERAADFSEKMRSFLFQKTTEQTKSSGS